MSTEIVAVGERLQKSLATGTQTTSTEVQKSKTFTATEWQGYVTEQVTKSTTDADATVKAARLAALAKALPIATEALAKAQSVTVEVFQEPVVKAEEPLAKQIARELAKGLMLLKDPKSELSVELAKSQEGRVTLKKAAGDAQTMLDKIVEMFGLTDEDIKNGRISWKVESAVRMLEDSARLDKMMNRMASSLGIAKKKDGAAATGTATPVTKAKSKRTSWPSDLGTKPEATTTK